MTNNERAQALRDEIKKIEGKRDFVSRQLEAIPGKIEQLESGTNLDALLETHKWQTGWATPGKIEMARVRKISALGSESLHLQKQIAAYDIRISKAKAKLEVLTTPTPRKSSVINASVTKRFIHFRTKYVDKVQHVAADKLGITASTLSNVENGIRHVSRAVIHTLVTKFGLNQTWFLTGEGDPKTQGAPPNNVRISMQNMMLDIERQQREIQKLEANLDHLYKVVENMQKEKK